MDEYVLDVELRFTDGDVVSESLIQGRDHISFTDQIITLALEVSAVESVEYRAERSQLNYYKVTRRKLEPEPKPGWIADVPEG